VIKLKNGPRNKQDLIDILTQCFDQYEPLRYRYFQTDIDSQNHSKKNFDEEYTHFIKLLKSRLTVRLEQDLVKSALSDILYNNTIINDVERLVLDNLSFDVYNKLQRLKNKYFKTNKKIYKDTYNSHDKIENGNTKKRALL